MARAFGSICSLLLVWLCAFGANPTQHSAAQSVALRGAAELALGDIAATPVLGTRALASGAASPRSIERNTASPLTWLAAPRRIAAARTQEATRRTLGQQALTYASRRRWRTHDPAAPPARSRIAR